jgi:hypothetical protein
MVSYVDKWQMSTMAAGGGMSAAKERIEWHEWLCFLQDRK